MCVCKLDCGLCNHRGKRISIGLNRTSLVGNLRDILSDGRFESICHVDPCFGPILLALGFAFQLLLPQVLGFLGAITQMLKTSRKNADLVSTIKSFNIDL